MPLRAPYFLRSRSRKSKSMVVNADANDCGAVDDLRDPDYVPSVDGSVDDDSVIVLENTSGMNEVDEIVIVDDEANDDVDVTPGSRKTKFMRRVFEFLQTLDTDGISLDEFVAVSGGNRLTLGDWKEGGGEVAVVEDADVAENDDYEGGSESDSDGDDDDDDDDDDSDYVPSDDGSDEESDEDYEAENEEGEDGEDDFRTPQVRKSKVNHLRVRFPRTPAKTFSATPSRFQFSKNDPVVRRLFKSKGKTVFPVDDEANDPDWAPTAEDHIQEREDERLDKEVSDRFDFEKDVKRARSYIRHGGQWRDTCLMEQYLRFRRGRMDYADFSWAMITSTAMSEFAFISKQAPSEGLRTLGAYISDTRTSPHKISVSSVDWEFLNFNHPQAVTLIEELSSVKESANGVVIDFSGNA